MIECLFRPRCRNLEIIPPFLKDDPRYSAVERWCEIFDIPEGKRDRSGDPEDFLEGACYLYEALDRGLPVHVIGPGQRPELITSINTGKPNPNAPVLHLGTAGLIDSATALPHVQNTYGIGRIVMPDPRSITLAMDYGSLSTFKRHAGRLCQNACHPDGDEISRNDPNRVGRVALDLLKQSGRDELKLLVKVTKPIKKYPPVEFTVTKESTEESVMNALFKKLEYGVVEIAGRQNALLVQERVRIEDFRDEYRVVVIGGKPVSGAGCVERYTPWDREKTRFGFDPWMEEIRNRSDVRKDVKAAEAYRREAHNIVREISSEKPDLRNYSLDLYRKPSGEIGIVELNPAQNLGLYSNDPKRIVAAMAKETEYQAERMPQTLKAVQNRTRDNCR